MHDILIAAEVLLEIIREADGLGLADQFIDYCAPELCRLREAVEKHWRGEFSAARRVTS